jgi:hypothetical protein
MRGATVLRCRAGCWGATVAAGAGVPDVFVWYRFDARGQWDKETIPSKKSVGNSARIKKMGVFSDVKKLITELIIQLIANVMDVPKKSRFLSKVELSDWIFPEFLYC